MSQPEAKVLTPEQKTQLINRLALPWGKVQLQCDGKRITLEVRQISKAMVYRVITFVEGEFKYEWAGPNTFHPEQKFLRKSVRPNISPVKRRELEKKLGKRFVKTDPYFGGSTTLFLPDWPNGKAAINHLCKVCEVVELIDMGLSL